MAKIVVAVIAAAAILAGVAVMVPGVSDEVEASTPQALAKGDRLDIRAYGPACSKLGWPHFEPACLRHTATPNRQAKPVRVITVDRLSIARTPAADHSLAMR
jgi:hypothetical protein